MPKRAAAVTRYGDLVGTVEIDGHTAPPLEDLAVMANVPLNYCPIGVEISLFETFDSVIYFAILAYDSENVGCGPDDAIAYVQAHGRLPVRRFLGRLQSSSAHRFFKRCLIVAVDSRSMAVANKLQVEEFDEPVSHGATLAKLKPR
jgi:hypothetical protein